MRLLLIKIGKAWNVLSRDGFWKGGKRVFGAFFQQFKRVAPGDILFITNGVGDSARYRTRHVAEELNEHGFRASVALQDNPFLFTYIAKFQVFVLHRVLATEKMLRFFEELKAAQKVVLFETDDLVYDPSYLHHMDYYSKMNTFEKKLYENGVGGEFLADPYLKYATTTTSFLQKKLEEKGKQVFLVRNKMSKEDVAWSEEILEKLVKPSATDGLLRISYLSGTPSHNKDFATITEPLLRILGEFPEVRLVLAGPLDTEDALNQYSAQIERVPFAPRREYFKTVASMDINVAPLEIGNPFCESKSELKFFEAGLLEVPTVAAATETFQGAITDGQDGFVAATAEEWYQKLRILITEKEGRLEMARAARKTTLERYTTAEGTSPEYYDFLTKQIQRV